MMILKRWKYDNNIDNILVEGDGIHYKYPTPHYHKNKNRCWESYPVRNGKRINIWTFETKEECELAIKKHLMNYGRNKLWKN